MRQRDAPKDPEPRGCGSGHHSRKRIGYAFGEKSSFKKIDFLTQFANFGVTKLVELIGDTPVESMENIKNFLAATVEGRNLDIDALPDDLLLEDY